MEENTVQNNTTEETGADQSNDSKSNRAKKGVALPKMTLEEIIKAMNDFKTRDVNSADMALLGLILGNSEKSSTFSDKKVALRTFDVVTESDKKVTLTAIGRGIAFPNNTEEKNLSIQKAFASHPILKKVWDSLKGRDFETEYLPNLMVSVGEVPVDKKDVWATYFASAIRTAKLTKTTDGREIVLSEFAKGGAKPKEREESPAQQLPQTPIKELPLQGNAEILEKLSATLTGGTKLQHRSGDCYVLVYLNGSLVDVEFEKLKKILGAAESLLDTFVKKENGQN